MTDRYDYGESRLRKSTRSICTGYEATLIQRRLRSANILLIGMKALANEIAKNLVLAGIGSLTIIDDQLVTEDDLGSQFFISELHVGLNVSIHPPPWRRLYVADPSS